MQEDNPRQKTLTPQQALSKAQNYCAYQERSHQEVRDKLYNWGLHSDDVETVIAELIENNFLNEERFAIAYALGKFRMKHWGKSKIKYHLKSKKIPEKIITSALNQINSNEYEDKINKITENKIESLKKEEKSTIKSKTYRYLLSKGYENDIIIEIINTKFKDY